MMYRTSIAFCAAFVASAAVAQPCEPQWAGLGSVDGGVLALTIFDEGAGESLFAGGGFVSAGGVAASHIARWDGAAWSDVGGGLSENGAETVRALGVFDDGSGAALYAGGALTAAGGNPANRIARWDGETWSALGDGVDGNVRAIAAFDEDGDGPGAHKLFVGGIFLNAGGSPARNIARWDGESWSAVGGGVDQDGGAIRALLVWDDGNGPALYATGTFTSLGGVAANNIARWDGQSWSALGDGITGGAGAPGISLTAWNDDDGKTLYVGGEMTSAGGQAASLCAGWDGKSWSNVGGGIAGTRVRAVATFDDGPGLALYCGGEFPGIFSRWDGAAWEPVGSGLTGTLVYSLQSAIRPQLGLFVGGEFTDAGGNPAVDIAVWAGCGTEECYADFTGDGALDLFDFLGFVNVFNAGDLGADCVEDGLLDLFDFLCFVNAFNAGC